MKSEEIIKNAVIKTLQNSQTMESGKKEEDIKILLMFSGGMDSTSLLYTLLKHTKCQIHVHHVTLIQNHNRHLAEKEATGKIIDYCKKNIRDFNVSYSTVDESNNIFGNATLVDNEVWGFVSCRVAMAVKPDVITFGVITRNNVDVWKILMHNMFTSFFLRSSLKNYIPEFIVPADYSGFENMEEKKVQVAIFSSIPKDVQSFFTSCRTPIKNGDKLEKCKTCHACKKIINIKKDIYLENCKEKHKDIHEDNLTSEHNHVYVLLDKIFNNKSDEELERFYDKYHQEMKRELQNSSLNEEYHLLDVINNLIATNVDHFSWDEKDNHWKRIEILIKLGADIKYIINCHNKTKIYFRKFLEKMKNHIDEEMIRQQTITLSWAKEDISKIRAIVEFGIVDINWIVKNHRKKPEYFNIFKEEMKDLYDFDCPYEILKNKRVNSHEKLYIKSAKKCGIKVEEINNNLKFSHGNISYNLSNACFIGLDSPESQAIQRDKNRSTNIAKHYFRTPEQLLINFKNHDNYYDSTLDYLERHGQIVLKPNAGTCMGKDVMLILHNDKHDNTQKLTQHLKYLSEKYDEIVVEEYIDATEYRLILVNNRPVLFIEKSTAIFIGDGHLTMKELAENMNKQADKKYFAIYNESGFSSNIKFKDLSFYLDCKGLTTDHILKNGEKMEIHYSHVKYLWNILTSLDLIEFQMDKILAFNEEVGLTLSAFDFYYKDGEIVFGEINSAPGIMMNVSSGIILNAIFKGEFPELYQNLSNKIAV